MTTPDATYTNDDHASRDEDLYALAKYEITFRWLAEIAPSGTLLNLGCGAGHFSEMAFERGYEVVGVEPDPIPFAMASERADGRYVVREAGIFDLSEADAASIVVMHDVLEHIDAEGAAIKQLRSLVASDGCVVLSVPALESLFGHHDKQLGHYRRYSKLTLRRAVEPTFEVIKIRYFGLSFLPAALWYSRLRSIPYPEVTAGGGLLGKALALACRGEQRVPFPLGTSVVVLLRPR